MEDSDWIAGISKKDAEKYSRQLLVNDFGVSGQSFKTFQALCQFQARKVWKTQKYWLLVLEDSDAQ